MIVIQIIMEIAVSGSEIRHFNQIKYFERLKVPNCLNTKFGSKGRPIDNGKRVLDENAPNFKTNVKERINGSYILTGIWSRTQLIFNDIACLH